MKILPFGKWNDYKATKPPLPEDDGTLEEYIFVLEKNGKEIVVPCYWSHEGVLDMRDADDVTRAGCEVVRWMFMPSAQEGL